MPARRVLAVVSILSVTVALRFGPLHLSPLPFNPDGIIHARWATETLSDGMFPLAIMSVDDLGFVGILSVVAAVTGVRVLTVAQPVSGLVGAVPVLLVIPIATSIARSHGWESGHAWLAGLLAGGLLAVEGLSLHRAMPTDEQTIGLLLVPLGGFAVWRAVRRRQLRWFLLSTPVLLAIPPVHNLESVVFALFLAMLVAFAAPSLRSRGAVLGLLGASVLYWLYLGTYFLAADRYTAAGITQSERLTAVPGLFLAWVVLAAFVARWFVGLWAGRQRGILLGVFGFGFFALAVNGVVAVFPGMPTTDRRLLLLLSPLVIVALLAAWASPLASRVDSDGPFLVSLVGAVLALVGLCFTAGLTPEYLGTAYRVQTFIHFPAVVLAGLGTVVLLRHRFVVGRPTVRTVVVVVVLLSAAASIPVAFAGLELMPYKGVTTPAELSVAGFATQHMDGPWASDDHVGRISRYHDWNISSTRGPAHSWLTGGEEPSCTMVSQASWTTTGAQFYPLEPESVSSSTYRALLDRRHVVYANSGEDPIAVSLPVKRGPCWA